MRLGGICKYLMEEEGKIETIAGALALASGASSENRNAINSLKEALVTLRAQVDRIIAAQAASPTAGGPTSPSPTESPVLCATFPDQCENGFWTSKETFDWGSIKSDLQKFDKDIGGVNSSVDSSQTKLRELNNRLQDIAPR